MPHPRPRLLSQVLHRSIQWSPIVAVLGARQCGKTTLLKNFAQSYRTFDDTALQSELERGGTYFLDSQKPPFFLDEVQKYPPIFDLLKRTVDETRRPGRFIITGSVRFSSKAGIQESLTGRIAHWELLPLTPAECHKHIDGPSALVTLMKNATTEKLLHSLKKRAWLSSSQRDEYLSKGGMPGSCFLRDAVQRENALSSLIDTVIERDFYYLRKSKLRANIVRDFLHEVAAIEGLPVSYSDLARRFKISVPTAKVTLDTLEGLFLLRQHDNTYFFEDVGISNLLSAWQRTPVQNNVLRLAYSIFKSWVSYEREIGLKLRGFHTRGGAHVPFIIETKGGPTLAICTDEDEFPSEKSIKSLYSFAKEVPEAKLLHLHAGESARIHKNRILSIPVQWLC